MDISGPAQATQKESKTLLPGVSSRETTAPGRRYALALSAQLVTEHVGSA